MIVGVALFTVTIYVCVAEALTPEAASCVAVIVALPTERPIKTPVLISTVATEGVSLEYVIAPPEIIVDVAALVRVDPKLTDVATGVANVSVGVAATAIFTDVIVVL